MDLTNEDVADILALLDSLPYDELDLQTASFRLTLRRTPDGWTQASQVLSEPVVLDAAVPRAADGADGADGAAGGAAEPGPGTGSMDHWAGYNRLDGPSSRQDGDDDGTGEADGTGGEAAGTDAEGRGDDGTLVAVRAPLPGTFYRAPRPGAEPFVEVGSRVTAETVVCIVETMKLMNSVHAGVDGTVAEICLANAEFAANGTTLMRIEAD
jgi:acetyl-CoA carboxylase biotin carboxyl carrier protein